MTNSFEVPASYETVVFPTEPTLPIDTLKIIEASTGDKKKKGDFMVINTNPDSTVQFTVIYDEYDCYAAKGFYVS